MNTIPPERVSVIALRMLREALGESVETDRDQLYPVAYDGLKIAGYPEALIKIERSEDVSAVLKIANDKIL